MDFKAAAVLLITRTGDQSNDRKSSYGGIIKALDNFLEILEKETTRISEELSVDREKRSVKRHQGEM